MKIVIIGDSTILFKLSQKISVYNTFGFILKEFFETKGNSVFVIGKEDNSTQVQSRMGALIYDIKQFKPNVVIISLGSVDCSPRLLTNSEIQLFFNELSFDMIKKKRFYIKVRYYSKKFQEVLVKIQDFQSNYQEILDEILKIGGVPIIINIAKPHKVRFKRSYNSMQKIKRYNKILSNLAEKNKCKLIDLYSLTETEPYMLSNRGFHLSKYGHRKMAELLIAEIEAIKRNMVQKKIL